MHSVAEVPAAFTLSGGEDGACGDIAHASRAERLAAARAEAARLCGDDAAERRHRRASVRWHPAILVLVGRQLAPNNPVHAGPRATVRARIESAVALDRQCATTEKESMR